MANLVNDKCYHIVSTFTTFYVCRSVKYHPSPVAVGMTGSILLYIHIYLFYFIQSARCCGYCLIIRKCFVLLIELLSFKCAISYIIELIPRICL